MNASAPPALSHDSVSHHGDGVAAGGRPPSLFSAAALERLYRAHAARLVRHFARRVGCDAAGDIVHDTFAKLAGAASDDRCPIESPEAFITTVATNVLRDRARAAARRAMQDQQLAHGPHQVVFDPHRLSESREALQAIDAALAAMNPRRRRIFLLHRNQQMTYAAIGEEVGMSAKGVKKQIAKALLALRGAVGDSA